MLVPVIVLLLWQAMYAGEAPQTFVRPAWWQDPVTTPFDNSKVASPQSPINIGQLKWTLHQALRAIRGQHLDLSAFVLKDCDRRATNIEAKLTALKINLDVPAQATAEWYGEQKSVVTLGQLKAAVLPFYLDLYKEVSPYSDFTEIQEYGLRPLALYRSLQLRELYRNHHQLRAGSGYWRGGDAPGHLAFGHFPWNPSAQGIENLKLANQAQLKLLFSFPIDHDHDLLDYLQEMHLGTDPSDPDSDGDSLPDGWEVRYGLDPKNLDSTERTEDADHDGLTNLHEFNLGSDPSRKNTDRTGNLDINDLEEGRSPVQGIFDQDDFELNQKIPVLADPDQDGLSSEKELQIGTDPQVADTDGDGLSDGWEHFNPPYDPVDQTNPFETPLPGAPGFKPPGSRPSPPPFVGGT